MTNNFDDLIKTYSKLGKKYIKDIDNLTPPEFEGFIKRIPKKGNVLEIGCAGGRDAKKFIKHHFQYTGVDLVDVFLNEAKKKNPKGKFIKMDILKLKFPKNYFDAIWANAILLHLDKVDIPKALKNIYGVLKPKGTVHIRVKWGKGTQNIKEKLSNDKARRFTFFYKTEIETYLKNTGFRIIFSKVVPDDLDRKNLKWVAIWGIK